MKQFFGASTRTDASTTNMVKPTQRKKEPAMDMGMCCVFFCYLSVIPFLFVFFYHIFPTTIVALVAIFALFSFIPCIFNRGDRVVSEPVGPLLSASMLACTGVIFLWSMRLYWNHVQPMRALTSGREYSGVYPSMPSTIFPDAAFLRFAGNTSVAVTESVNMKSLESGMNTFCAAPVTGPQFTGRVEYWAVGVDCCGDSESSRFACDDAGIHGARNAYVMQDPRDPLFNLIGKHVAPARLRRDIFMKATKKAERHKQFVSAQEPLFVRWTKLSRDEVISSEVGSIVASCVIQVIVAALMSLFLAKINAKFSALRAEARREKESQDGWHDGAAQRLDEFMEHIHHHADHGKSMLHASFERPPLNRMDVFIMIVAIPYIVMMLCMLLTTYSGCWISGHYVTAPFLTILGISILALLSTPNRAINGLFLLLVSCIGLSIGSWNYNTSMFHYCAIGGRQTYSRVHANATSRFYQDAGILKFHSTAYLSQEDSVGFLHQGNVYCAAPILSRDGDCPNEAKAAITTTAIPSSNNDDDNYVPSKSAGATSFLQRTSRMQTSLDVDEEEWDPALAENEDAGDTVVIGERDNRGDSPTWKRITFKDEDVATQGTPGDSAITAPTDSSGDSSTSGTSSENTANSAPGGSPANVANPSSESQATLSPSVNVDSAAGTSITASPAQCNKVQRKRVDFWAIGINCCDARRGFVCDGGADSNSHSGVVVGATGAEDVGDPRHQFFKAISMAAAVNGLPKSDDAVLIRWGSDPQALQSNFAKAAVGVIVVTAFVGFLSLLFIGVATFYYNKRLRLGELKEERSHIRENQKGILPTPMCTAVFTRSGNPFDETDERNGDLSAQQSPVIPDEKNTSTGFFSRARETLRV